MTIRDVAELAGVSIATVSRVVNDRPDVSPETRRVVMRVMREHGFAMNRSARGLARGRTGLVGFTVPLLSEPYFTDILAGAADALSMTDQRLVICPTHHQHAREVSLLERLMGGTTDGAIVVLPEETNAELLRLQDLGYPFVVCDPREPPIDGIPTVCAAHADGARAAVGHLLALGHRRIAMIIGSPGWVASEERLEGYRVALATAGIAFDEQLVAGGSYAIQVGRRATAQLLSLAEPPTAIFASNDNLAFGAIRAIVDRGLRVPDDVSIVGFDDTEHASCFLPSLTTVRQPLAELGRTAVSLLNRILDGQRIEALRVELATRLVVRASTGPARV
ncbi:MAG TPA: LacI family DNA-binding transcriptional regulator [Gaiellaceae bacterium]